MFGCLKQQKQKKKMHFSTDQKKTIKNNENQKKIKFNF